MADLHRIVRLRTSRCDDHLHRVRIHRRDCGITYTFMAGIANITTIRALSHIRALSQYVETPEQPVIARRSRRSNLLPDEPRRLVRQGIASPGRARERSAPRNDRAGWASPPPCYRKSPTASMNDRAAASMVRQRAALDALVAAGVVGGVPGDMANPGVLPERKIPPPVLRRANAQRDPDFDPHRGRIASRLLGPRAQLFEPSPVPCRRPSRPAASSHRRSGRCVAGSASAWPPHQIGMRPGRRPRVDARVVDTMPLPSERHMRLRPQRPHHLDLLLRAAAAVVKILVQPFVFDLVPADTDTQSEFSPAEQIEPGGLLGHQDALPLRHDHDAGGEAQDAWCSRRGSSAPRTGHAPDARWCRRGRPPDSVSRGWRPSRGRR